jgi:DNA-binding NarL/FixJ family response regulator/signal transduction histidine kinase
MHERRSLLRRVRELPPPVADGLLAALITLIGLSQLFYESPLVAHLGWDFRDPDALAVLLTLCQTMPLVWRRRAPRLVLAVSFAAVFVHLVLGYQPTWAQVAMLVALYTVAAHSPRRQSVVTGLLFGAGLVLYGVIVERMYPSSGVESFQGWVFSIVQFVTAWFLGDLQKRRLAYTARLEALNAQLAGEQERRARWAVAEERGRIARELHDVVAHSVSVMVVQAGAARRSVAANPAQATAALTQIESTGRQALAEMRRLLGLLRDRRGGREALTPQPSLAHLDSLVLAAREAGLAVELTVEGEPRPLPAGIDLSAYRIVQEALTNSLKHAGARQRRRAGLLRRGGAGGAGLGRRPRGGSPPGRRAGGGSARGRRAGGGRARHGLAGGRRRARAHRHAGAGRPVRRRAGGRAAARRRLPGRRPPPAGGRRPAVTRVLIADDQPLMRTGFRMILDAEPDIEVVGEAADGEEAVRLAGHVRADVVLMDVRMPRVDGIEATRRLAGAQAQDPVRVLILTTFDLDEYVLAALRAGASGFLLKDAPPEDLVEAIRVVAAGDALLAPSVTRRLLDRFAANLPDPAAVRPAALDSLTAREVEVLGLVARGMSNAEIAEHLVVSETTVKTHVGRVLAKLDLRDRVQAVVLAYETGIVRPGVP